MKTLEAVVTSKKRETTVTYRVKMRTNAGVISYNNKTIFVKEKEEDTVWNGMILSSFHNLVRKIK